MSTAPTRLTVVCPHCASRLDIKASLAGRAIRCPKCQGEITVDGPAPYRSPPPIPTQSMPTPAQHQPAATAGFQNPATEQEIWSGRPSLFVLFWSMVCFGVIGIVALALAVRFGSPPLIVLVLAGLILCAKIMRVKSTHYALTSQRLKISQGWLARKTVEIELFRIRDLSVVQGILQPLLGIGAVRAVSSDRDAEEILLAGIADPAKVKEQLRHHVMLSRAATGTRDVDMAVMR